MSLIDHSYDDSTYDHVPTLRELMPTNAGLPGVHYGLVAVANQRAAQDEGWGSVTGSRVLSIVGPKGKLDVVLACQGNPVRGLDPNAGARRLYLDDDIYNITGLWLGALPEHLTAEAKPAKSTDTKPSSKSTKPAAGGAARYDDVT